MEHLLAAYILFQYSMFQKYIKSFAEVSAWAFKKQTANESHLLCMEFTWIVQHPKHLR